MKTVQTAIIVTINGSAPTLKGMNMPTLTQAHPSASNSIVPIRQGVCSSAAISGSLLTELINVKQLIFVHIVFKRDPPIGRDMKTVGSRPITTQ
jgi:hypothetical protein